MIHLRKTDQRGSLILMVIIVLPFLILMAMYYMRLSLTSYQVARLDQLRTSAQLAADAGADYAVEQFSQDNSWTGTGGEIQIHNDGKVKTTYEAAISGDDTSKTVAVTGRTYWPAGATTPTRKVAIYVDLKPVTAGSFSVVSGEGGLLMSNSAKIVGGDVFVNGEISLQNTSQIGLSTNPLKVDVANQRCPSPADATYPRVCNSGENGEPIAITNSAHIYGTVTATHQTTTSGMSDPGLVSGTVAPKALPTYDRAAQKAAVATTITAAAASCSGSQTKTWAANTKITGDVTITNKCKVTVLGDVWITGSLSVSNSSEMIVATSAGTNRPNIMVDGSAGASFQNTSALTPNSSNTGFEIYTFYSTASCSPDCAEVTGTDLASSRSITTITLNNSGSNPNTIFYAYWSQIEVQQSGQIGAVIGQTIKLSNSGTITFGTSSGIGNTTWVINGYRRQ
jgi:Tfp pilus assembly protein PilX